MYSMVEYWGVSSAGKLVSEICWAYYWGNGFLELQKGQVHVFYLKSTIHVGLRIA